MRSLMLSVVVGLGVIGLFAATPTPARADEWHGRGYGYGRGYGGGYYNRGYYHRDFDDRRFYNRGYYGGYPYGGYGVRNFYTPPVYGGVYAPLGLGGYGLAPYPNYYYTPGFVR